MEQESGHIDGQRGIVGRFHLFGLIDVIRYDQPEYDQPVTLVPRLRELLLHLNIISVSPRQALQCSSGLLLDVYGMSNTR